MLGLYFWFNNSSWVNLWSGLTPARKLYRRYGKRTQFYPALKALGRPKKKKQTSLCPVQNIKSLTKTCQIPGEKKGHYKSLFLKRSSWKLLPLSNSIASKLQPTSTKFQRVQYLTGWRSSFRQKTEPGNASFTPLVDLLAMELPQMSSWQNGS